MNTYDAYNDSQTDWVKNVPVHWQIARIKDIADVNSKVLRENTSPSYEFDYVDIASVTYGQEGYLTERMRFENAPSRARRIVEQGDIILSTVRTYLRAITSIKDDIANLIVSTGFAVISPKKQYINDYFAYLFLSDTILNTVGSLSKGVSYPAINASVVKDLFCLVPPIEEQKKIADYLDGKTAVIDQKVTLLTQKAAHYSQLKQSLINETVTRGLDKTVPLKESGVDWLGQIPAHWHIKRVKDELTSLDYRRIPLSGEERGKMENQKYDYYGASGVIDQVDDYLFDEPLILLGEDGANLLLRNSPLAFIAKGKYWVNNHAHVLKPRRGNLEFFRYLLESIDYTVLVSGAAQPKLTASALNNVFLRVPPLCEQNAITDYLNQKVAQIDSIIGKTHMKIKKLKELRKSLINDVVMGKIKVVDLDDSHLAGDGHPAGDCHLATNGGD